MSYWVADRTMSDMLKQRDDFPPATKTELARRVGHRCSMPSCRAATSGPSATRGSGTSNAGVAAHITAASSGARYDPALTHEQGRDSSNGIWLCQNHAKIIDDDESRFTPELLRAWRQ